MSSQDDVIKRHLEGFRYLPGESVEALIGRFTELLSDMKTAEIMVPSHMSNKRLLDVLKKIPDQPNCSWFMNVNQIILTNNCFKMKPDELISLIRSYDKADKQKAQDTTSAAVCSSTSVPPVSSLPAVACSSTPADSSTNSKSGFCAGTPIYEFTPTPSEVCVDDICCTKACREKVSGYKAQTNSLVMQLQLSKSDLYQIKKKINGYKDIVEAQKRDIRQLQNDLSQEKCRHLHFKELSEKLTVELGNLKSTFENTEFNFKKFDVSSEKVEKMINQQLKYSKRKSEIKDWDL